MRVAITGYHGLSGITEMLVRGDLWKLVTTYGPYELVGVTCAGEGPESWFARCARWRRTGRTARPACQNGPMSTTPAAPGSTALAADIAARLKRTPDGLLPAVAQQYDTGEVLMLGWMDDEALHRTLTTGRCTYWSRSRNEYWVKGDTSGHLQLVKSVALDCDGDTLLVRVDQVGAACHTGARTCFDEDVLLPADR